MCVCLILFINLFHARVSEFSGFGTNWWTGLEIQSLYSEGRPTRNDEGRLTEQSGCLKWVIVARNCDCRTTPRQYRYLASVLRKIIVRTFWNQNQNHDLKNDSKLQSISLFSKWFEIRIIVTIFWIMNITKLLPTVQLGYAYCHNTRIILSTTAIHTGLLSTSAISQI